MFATINQSLRRFITRSGFPTRPNRDPTKDLCYLRRADGSGEIEYVYIDEPNSSILLFVNHGQSRTLDAQSVSQWRQTARDARVSIALHNYPGYGGTTGPAGDGERIGRDCIELLAHLRGGRDVVVLGNSIGCGPTMWIAAQRVEGVRRMVLISPYTSIWALLLVPFLRSVPVPWWMMRWMLARPGFLGCLQREKTDPFPVLDMARGLGDGMEIMIFHGERDGTVPLSHSKAIYRELQKNPNVSAGHCVLPLTAHSHTRMFSSDAIYPFVRGDEKEMGLAVERLRRGEFRFERNRCGSD